MPDSKFCEKCRRVYYDAHRCDKNQTQSFRGWAKHARECCDACEHWGTVNGSTGCKLLPTIGVRPNKPCDIRAHRSKGKGCFDRTNPRFADYYRGGIGFLAVTYLEIGGTEVWHRTLLPRLGDDVSGFVVLHPHQATGDFSLLGCPTGIGKVHARALAESCDVLVVWGLGDQLGDVLRRVKNRPRVISVSHCDNRSTWTVDFMQQQAKYSDAAVYISPNGANTVPESLRHKSVMIGNAPDPKRIIPKRDRSETRRAIGVPDDAVMLLVTSRISEEKRIDVLVDAIAYLPAWYHLVIAGRQPGDRSEYLDRLKRNPDPRVKFLPATNDVSDLLAAADACLSAATYEGYGLAMAEALLAGVPLIATRRGLIEWEPHLAAIVDDDATAAQWAAAIRKDFENPIEQRRRADESQAYIERNHSVDQFVDAWRSLCSHDQCDVPPVANGSFPGGW